MILQNEPHPEQRALEIQAARKAAILDSLEVDIREAALRNVNAFATKKSIFSAAAKVGKRIAAASLIVGGCAAHSGDSYWATTAKITGRATAIHSMVDSAAERYNVPKHIAHGVVRAESNYRCTAYNARSGASGIMQVLPATARGVGVTGNLSNCHNGLEAGMRYLRLALNRGGDGCTGVSLYERGIYARPVCTAYGRKVVGFVQ